MIHTLADVSRRRLEAKQKHLWLSACASYRGFADQPGALRLAILLFELYDPQKGYAWPSRRYMSDRLGTTAPSVSKWLRILSAARAVEKVPSGQVEPGVLAATKRTAKRAQYYRLGFAWAAAVMSGGPASEADEEEDWDAVA